MKNYIFGKQQRKQKVTIKKTKEPEKKSPFTLSERSLDFSGGRLSASPTKLPVGRVSSLPEDAFSQPLVFSHINFFYSSTFKSSHLRSEPNSATYLFSLSFSLTFSAALFCSALKLLFLSFHSEDWKKRADV